MLDELRKALPTNIERAREIACQFKLPKSQTAMWVNSLLALPWTMKGENYFSYPIGKEIFKWLQKGNADRLQGAHYVRFLRALHHAAWSETSDFILATVSPFLITRLWPESMCHFLWLLRTHIAKDSLPQGLKDCLAAQISEHWQKIYPSHIGMINHHDRRLGFFYHCLTDATKLGIDLRDIVERNVIAMGYLLSICYLETMACFECFLLEDSTSRGVSLEESLEFQRMALHRVGIRRPLPGELTPRTRSITESKEQALLLEPWTVEELLTIFTDAHRAEKNPSLKSLLRQSCGQLVEILTVYHIQHKLHTIWPEQCPGLEKWSGWGMFAVFPAHDSGADRLVYPIIRLLAHNGVVMRKYTAVDKSSTAVLAVINGLVEMLWQIRDVHELSCVDGILGNESGSDACRMLENAANCRHVYANNQKAVRIGADTAGGWRFPYLRWISPQVIRGVQQKKHLLRFPVTRAVRMENLADTLIICLDRIANIHFAGNPFSWHLYLFLHSTSGIATTSEPAVKRLGDLARQWVSTLQKPASLLKALRDGLRADLPDDALVQSIFTKLHQLPVKMYSFDELWKISVLHIHVGRRSGYKTLPKNFLFGVFNSCYDTLQSKDSKEVAKHAKILPDIIFLLSHLKLNKLTLAKLTEMCHLMMHHSLRVSTTCASLCNAFVHLILPPVAHDSCENFIAGRILPSSGNWCANPVWLDKVQVQRFIERSLEQLRNDDAMKHPNRCRVHKSSDIIGLCELCIVLRHNSAATDDLIHHATSFSCPAIDVEICRLGLAFGKPCGDTRRTNVLRALAALPGSPETANGVLCESSRHLTLHNLLPLAASLIRHTKGRDHNLLVPTLNAILGSLHKATPEAVRFMLDLLRSENPVLGNLLERDHFTNAQQRVLREVSRRIQNHTATIETVLDVVGWHIGTAETCYDSEMNHCLRWISTFLLDGKRRKRVEHLVAIVRMMARCGYRHEFILRRSLDIFMATPTTSSYHVTSILSSLRKLDIHDMYNRSESIELIKGMHAKLRALPSLSGRLIASVLTSLSVLIQTTIGASAEVDDCISQLCQVFASSVQKEAPSMDCITISAILFACARLNFKRFLTTFPRLFERSAFLDWAKYPTQAVHFILATAEIDPTQEILVYLLFSEEVAAAIRCVLDHPSSYKNLHTALRLIARRVPSLNLFDSPLAKLTFASIEKGKDPVDIENTDHGEGSNWEFE